MNSVTVVRFLLAVGSTWLGGLRRMEVEIPELKAFVFFSVRP